MITHKKKFVVSDILQMKWEMSFGGSPLHSDEQGCRAQCTWKRVGREGSVALGQEWGLWGGGVQPHSVNPAHKSSWGGGSEKRGPFKHIGRAAASKGSRVLWSEWNFSKTKFLTSCFLPRLLKRCVVMRWAQNGSGHCFAGLFASQEQS